MLFGQWWHAQLRRLLGGRWRKFTRATVEFDEWTATCVYKRRQKRVNDDAIRSLASGGVPIRLKALVLSDLSNATVDPERFELPDRVLNREEIRRQNEPFEWAPAFDRQPKG